MKSVPRIHGWWLIVLFVCALPPATARAQAPAYVTSWGGTGSGNGQFHGPTGVAVDASGYVYVVDQENYRVQKFTSDGTYVTQWGTYGTGNGQFGLPFGIAVDATGNVFVSDPGWPPPDYTPTDRIQKFSSTGTFLGKWGATGTGNGQFQAPRDLDVDASGNVYVADNWNGRVQKFTGAGAYLAQWEGCSPPFGIAVGGDGRVYSTSIPEMVVCRYTSAGSPLTLLPGSFYGPTDVEVDADGYVYVVDQGHNRILAYRGADDQVVGTWGSAGMGPGQFSQPGSIAVGPGGAIYVSDYGNDRIQKFAAITTPAQAFTWGRLKALYR